MYDNEEDLQKYVECLNEFGTLTTALLARRFKLGFDEGVLVLKKIIENYDNVQVRSEHAIYIPGREPEFWKIKKKPPRKKRQSKWKDVSKESADEDRSSKKQL